MPAGYVSVMAIPLTVDALGLVIVMVNCEELATPEVTVDGVKDTLTVSGRRVADAGRASEAAISSTTIEATTAAVAAGRCQPTKRKATSRPGPTARAPGLRPATNPSHAIRGLQDLGPGTTRWFQTARVLAHEPRRAVSTRCYIGRRPG